MIAAALDHPDRAVEEGADPLGLDELLGGPPASATQAGPRQTPSMNARRAIASRWAAMRAAGSGESGPPAGAAASSQQAEGGSAADSAYLALLTLESE